MRKQKCPLLGWLCPRMRKLWKVVGRRGLFLVFLAMLDAVIGYFLMNPAPEAPMQPFPFLTAYAWGWWWDATAAVCVLGAFTYWDHIAYGAAAFIKAGWGLRYAYLWIVTDIPYAWTSMMVWLTFAATVLVVASWPEEDDIILPPGPKGNE